MAEKVRGTHSRRDISEEPATADIALPEERRPETLPLWRRILGIITGGVFFGLLLYDTLALDLSRLYSGGNIMERYGWLFAVMFCLQHQLRARCP